MRRRFFALTERRMAIARFGAGLMCGVDNGIGIPRERLPFIEFIDVDETRARPGYRRPVVREKLRRVDGQRAIRPAAIGGIVRVNRRAKKVQKAFTIVFLRFIPAVVIFGTFLLPLYLVIDA
ncbi:hypothetical protein WK17_12240 [Burkholderia multivorans]|nr:hypothetical protein WK17_12240 [Burkholderia multivorans]